MTKVHPLASVDPAAELGEDVSVGPFAVVEAGAVIGARTRVEAHASIRANATLGEDNLIGIGAVLGGDPQDAKYKGETTFLTIGSQNIFREYVTVHRASGEGNTTKIGDRNFLMAYSHLGHNVVMGNNVTMANSVGVSGYATIEDLVTIGGMTGVHQFVRIGRVAMVGGLTRVVRDVPPFMISSGENQEVRDINAVGLRRLGISPQERLALHRACRLLYRSQLGLSKAMEIVRAEVPSTEHVDYLLAFEQHRYAGKNGRGNQP